MYKKFEGENVVFDYTDFHDKKRYKVTKKIMRFLLLFTHRIKFIGKENIPEKGGFIVASNHVSNIDPAFIMLSTKKPIHFMAKAELFTNSFKSFWLQAFNAFPVKRGTSDRSSIDYAIELIKQEKVLGMFPEGTCSEDGIPLPAKAGVALVAKATGADVLPVAICSKNRGHVFQTITVRIGKLITYQELGLTPDKRSSSELKSATREIMDKIVKLWEKGPNAYDNKKIKAEKNGN